MGKLKHLILLGLIAMIHLEATSQVTTYQFRRVPDDKYDEFIKRETTYWSKVAQKAVDNKRLTFWALLEKMGGWDLPNSSNFLFINTFTNIDSAGSIWADSEKVGGVAMSEMETGSMSTTTSQFFLHDEGWVQDAKADPSKDFNYVVIIYHNSNDPDSLISLEKKYWSPFIKKAMDADQTKQVAWGNARILAPLAENIKFNSVSYDLYKTLQDALLDQFDPKTVFPTKGLDMINKMETNPRGRYIFRVVKVVAAQ